jgi:hypothetical protein
MNAAFVERTPGPSTPPRPASGSVLGIDVGYSPTQRSSAVCRLTWTPTHVDWTIRRYRAIAAEREATIRDVAGVHSIDAVALDGPLRTGFDLIRRYRRAERMLTRRLQPFIGKPGQSSSPNGIELNRAASECAKFLHDALPIRPAAHDVAISDRAIVEAFPTSFLGVMLDAPRDVPITGKPRSDRYFVALSREDGLARLIGHLLPDRTMRHSLAGITNHDDRAALACAVTALCVAMAEFCAVGDADGWIILPPPSFVRPWARRELLLNASDTT